MGTPRVFPVLALLVVIGLVGSIGARARADGEDGAKIYKKALRSTVWVLSRLSDKVGTTGSGSVVDVSRRLVLTNDHVVRDAKEVYVLFPILQNNELVSDRKQYIALFQKGGGVRGQVVLRSPKKDLALIQLAEALPPGALALPLAKKSVGPGQKVHSVGNPGRSGGLFLYTPGQVRQVYSKKWTVEDNAYEARVVETTSPTNAGDSGGPLLNDRGELVGVTQGANADAQLLSLFIDLSEVSAFLKNQKVKDPPPAVTRTKVPASPGKSAEGDRTLDLKSPADEPAQAEKDAARKLGFAKSLEDGKRLDKAKGYYLEIIEKYPATKAAKEAKERLQKLEK